MVVPRLVSGILSISLLSLAACTKTIERTVEVAPPTPAADKAVPPPATPPVVTPPAPASPDSDDGTSVTIARGLLGKDLVVGGYVANVDYESDIGNIPGLEMLWLTTKLVRLNVRGTGPTATLSITRSPRRPWAGTENAMMMEPELSSLAIKKLADDKITIDARALGAELSGLFKSNGVADKSTAGRAYDFTAFDGGLSLTVDNRLQAQVVNASGAPEPITATLAIRFYVKARTDNPTFRPQTVSPNWGYFTLDDIGYRRADNVYKRQAEKHPESKILKWDLSKPITLTVSDAVPAAWRPVILAGVASWNKALREELDLGFDFIHTEIAKVSVQDIGDPRKNVLYWEKDPTKGAGLMHVTFANDPLTGEIFNGSIYSDGDFWVEQLGKIYDIQLGNRNLIGTMRTHVIPPPLANDTSPLFSRIAAAANGPGELSTAFPLTTVCDRDVAELASLDLFSEKNPVSREEFVRSYTQEAIVHELGHFLGLRHNFMGSLAYRPHTDPGSRPDSVMDYASNSTYLRGHALGAPGRYDRQAIRYGYKFEKAANPLPFCTDDETTYKFGTASKSEFNAHCARSDEGEAPLIDFWIPRLEKIYVRLNLEKDPFERLALIEAFATSYEFQSTLYAGSLNSYPNEKLRFASFTEGLLKLSQWENQKLTDSPEFHAMRAGLAATFLLRTTMWPSTWPIDTGPTLTGGVLHEIEEMILGGELAKAGLPDLPLNERLKLLRQLFDVARRSVNGSNRYQALDALADLRRRAQSELDSPGTYPTRKEELRMIQKILTDLPAESLLGA